MSNQLAISEISFLSSPVRFCTPKFAMFHVAISKRFGVPARIPLGLLVLLEVRDFGREVVGVREGGLREVRCGSSDEVVGSEPEGLRAEC